MTGKKTLEQFNKELKSLRKEIKKAYCETGSDVLPMYDGPISPEVYYNSDIKIAWLLKEGYDNDTGKGNWNYTELAKENAYENFFSRQSLPTWHPIIYASYGILNGFKMYNDMEYIRDKPAMCDVVKTIAIVNVQKLPAKGGTITDFWDINKAFDTNTIFKVLEKQIEVLDPDILIGGSTMHLFKGMFEIDCEKPTKNVLTDYYFKNHKLYVDAYHPAVRKSKQIYVDEIVEAAQHWASQ